MTVPASRPYDVTNCGIHRHREDGLKKGLLAQVTVMTLVTVDYRRFLMPRLLSTRTMAEAEEENGDQGRCSG